MGTISTIPRSGRLYVQPRRRSLALMLLAFLDTVMAWRERARQRRQLLGLDDRQLRDIGLSRCDALREFDKPAWRG